MAANCRSTSDSIASRRSGPAADEWNVQGAADDSAIQDLLCQSQTPGGFDLNIFHDRPFDQTGKADDAEDFEDISDGDLPSDPDEADETNDNNDHNDLEDPDDLDDHGLAIAHSPEPGLTDDPGSPHESDDDLFGEGLASSPCDALFAQTSPTPSRVDEPVHEPVDNAEIATSPHFRDQVYDAHQAFLTNQDPDIPAAAETREDLLRAAWPTFRRGEVISWNQLLPTKRANWVEKKPAKKPKALTTTKLNLEIDIDDEKLFRTPGPAAFNPRNHSLNGTGSGGHIHLFSPTLKAVEDKEEDMFDLDRAVDDDQPVGGFRLADFSLACDDWSAQIDREFISAEESSRLEEGRSSHDGGDDWDAQFLSQDAYDTSRHDAPDANDAPPPRQSKKRPIPQGLPHIATIVAPSFDNHEEVTRRAAKRVRLDLNDPYLFIETQPVDRSKGSRDPKSKRMANGSLGRDVLQRFNRSNDGAYEALKENHQSKIRATLGHLTVEHSMPALRLLWPYYLVTLEGTADHYHRPNFRTNRCKHVLLHFASLGTLKRKHMKGKAHEVYRSSKDLGLGDNSTAVLFEYCERTPRMLSKFGMGNRIINYYRRKDAKSTEEVPPKLEIGESHVLLPEDRSPFSVFGAVPAGEVVPTLHNQMFRAPIFKHAVRQTDFLCGRGTTGLGGMTFYLRKLDHLFVVGQNFPSIEVPGPHSRKVTNVFKARMRMLAYRLIRKDPNRRCHLADITVHIQHSTEPQNRQKLKEFLAYERKGTDQTQKGTYKLRDGEVLYEESTIRTMVKPEEVCLLDSMQLGMKELEDAGYDPRNAVVDDDPVDQDDGPGVGGSGAAGGGADDEADRTARQTKKAAEKADETFADKMAPWKTTKAFIDACAGKAMLQLHGDGDPTGNGLGFSFIKTSMKGGYLEAVQGPLATSADAMEREKRANGGHAYNVKKQEAMYHQGIRDIWDKQRDTLSDATAHEDADVLQTADEDDRFQQRPNSGQTGPAMTAAAAAAVDDEVSQMSGYTASSRQQRRRLRIVREYRTADGGIELRTETVEDPGVIATYMKKKADVEHETRDLYKVRPTGNMEFDRQEMLRIKKELERLERNKARRQAREQQKELQRTATTVGAIGGSGGGVGLDGVESGGGGAASPEPSQAEQRLPASLTGTTRKCANCGQVGHIKTNKKLCPMLNGSMKADDGATDHGGFGSFHPTGLAGSP